MRTPLFLVVSIAFVATWSSSVPKSVLKVKVWYDIGFLQGEQIGTHAKAKEFIHASFGHVQHFMCSSLLGTQLETKVSFISLNLTYPEVSKFQNFSFYS